MKRPADCQTAGLRGEWAVTERLRKAVTIPPGSAVVLGIGDDCAIYRPRNSAEDLLFTSDMVVEGVHFLRDLHKPAELGRKALARSLSDIAAMGGSPRFALVALCIPGWARSGRRGAGWVNRFFDGILRLAEATGTVLAGGDLSSGERLVCDVTVCGAVPRGSALLRDGARPGNRIYVSGELGGSASGLAAQRGKAWRRHVNPEPRLALGRFLREKLRATSAIDLSDGLSLDLKRLCLASGLAAEIVAPPVFPGATLEQALHGGEDYELLFTVPEGSRVPAAWQGLKLTWIGEIVKGRAGNVRMYEKALSPSGFDHLRVSKIPPGTV